MVSLAGIGIYAILETMADRVLTIEMRRMLPNQQILEFGSDEADKDFSN